MTHGHGFTTDEERSIRARMPQMNPFIRLTYKLMLENNVDYQTADTMARLVFAAQEESKK